ncbi:MAG TPA: cytochrome c3 family protein, partial [Myxococcaceae bacterium]|nr:cytochrome c3 family protein [Myxococcaceae bacterium]
MSARRLGWIALGLAATGYAATGRERSLAVYPAQRMPLMFDHAKHLAAGADCLTCHDSARKSDRASDLLLPKGSGDEHPDCDPCHDIAKAKTQKLGPKEPPSRCMDCHVGFDETAQKEPTRVDFPAPNVVFPHRLHVQKKIK